MRKFNDQARNKYADWFGESQDTITQWMNEETWMSGSEMAQKGYITSTKPGGGLTNRIDPDRWQFKNRAILQVINSGIPQPQNTDGMKKNKILDAFNNALTAIGVKNDASNVTLKAGEFKNAFKEALDAMGDDDDADGVVNAITTALSGDNFRNAVTAEVTKVLATVPTNITDAIAAAVKDGTKNAATVTALNELKDEIANKLGTPAKPKNHKNGKSDDDDAGVLSISKDEYGNRFVNL